VVVSVRVTTDVGQRIVELALADGEVGDRTHQRITYRPDKVLVELRRNGTALWGPSVICLSGRRMLSIGRPGRTRVEEPLHPAKTPVVLTTWLNATLLDLNRRWT
jgi:hypothetical protein